jgi:DNA-directed RNA polymerase specialized sigma24 family protein
LTRRILAEHARRHNPKRGGEIQCVALEAAVMGSEEDTDLVALDDAMNALARLDPPKVQVAEVRFLGGPSLEETAEVFEVSYNYRKARLESGQDLALPRADWRDYRYTCNH